MIHKIKPIGIQGWGYLSFCGEPCLSFFFSASTVATYIFTALIWKATIISLEPCALNANFQHFIPRSNKHFLLYDILERRVWSERRPKDREGEFTNNFSIYTYLHAPKYLHWPHVGVKNTYTHCNRISVSVNFFDVFTLIGDLPAVYTAIDTYTYKTGLDQWWVVLTCWLKTNASFQSSSSENWQ